ncbi:hypothetical protein INT43_008451 [Umbelopsis isabellina]|uniref:Ricin B lectin domain-containing protein n=1 Tax=Mortierella isabellina TaxID=91625 RepID=A0A8H7PV46_MORIS|nr:hypothetical protein INT43_008451 [Umbelopsis isabellina]
MLKSLVLYGISAMLLTQGALARHLFTNGKYLIAQAEVHPAYITPAANKHDVIVTSQEHVWEVSFTGGGFYIKSVATGLYMKGLGKQGYENHGDRQKKEEYPVILETNNDPQAWDITEFDVESKSYRVAPIGDHESVLSHHREESSPLILQNKEYGNDATHQLWRFVQVN